MALLAGTNYDPTTAVSKATTAGLAMTAIDTTNLRLSFTVPSNGAVLVRLRGTLHGAATYPAIFLGVMQAATVKGRIVPVCALRFGAATAMCSAEALFVVSGLTPAASLTWDAAYSVDNVVAATGLKYGGPNNTTANDAFGGFVFEIWETNNLLGNVLYDPTTAVSKTAANTAMAAVDTTNCRITFTAPASGNVLVRLHGAARDSAGVNTANMMLGVLDGSTVRGRGSGVGSVSGGLTSPRMGTEVSFVVTGLTPSTSYTWDAAFGMENASGPLAYGGPDDATVSNAWGAIHFAIWSA